MFQCIQNLPENLQKNIKKIITKQGYEKFDLKITNLNTGGDNFLGNLYEIDIKGDAGDGDKETNLFVKVIINIEKIKMICVKDVYLIEMFLYNELSKIFKVLQDEANIPIKERYNTARSFDETNCDVIILENLNRNGFKTCSRFDVMPLKFAQLAIQQLAKFHGMSFVIENKMPVFYNNRIKTIKHPFDYNDDFRSMVTNNCRHILNFFNNDKKSRVDIFTSTIFEKFINYNTDTNSFKCCLTHGDYKISNILVRETIRLEINMGKTKIMSEAYTAPMPIQIGTDIVEVVHHCLPLEGEAVEVVPVDYQLMDYGCPIRDFLFFIFTGTDQEFRRKHLQDLKEMYFDTMTQFLKYFQIDVEDVYPKKEFERVYSEWLDFGLIKFMYGAVFLYASEEGLDVQTLSLTELPFNVCPDFEERVRGIVDDFIEWGYL